MQEILNQGNPVLASVLAGNLAEVAAMACTDDDLVALSLGDDHAATLARYRQWVESNDVDYDVAAGLVDEGVVLASVAKYARALREHLQERANMSLTSS